jgi:nitrogen fixation NifU-like protein
MELVSGVFFDHFINPRNAGVMENPDGMGICGDAVCGDYLVISIKVSDGAVSDIRFQCRGCPAAIATSSALTELALGKALEEALDITSAMIEDAVGGLPEHKRHCSVLGAEALGMAIADYRSKRDKESGIETEDQAGP